MIALLRVFFVLILLYSCTVDPPKKSQIHSDTTPDKEVLRVDENAISIRMHKDDTLLVEDQRVVIDSLEQALKKGRKTKGRKATIVLYVHPETSFGLYSKVQLTLEEEIDRFRNDEARDKFNKHYEDLDDSQQAEINNKYHLRIIERKL